MPSIIKYIGTIKQGLSLVVVEDGLVQCAEAYDKAVKDSLNPSCRGRWSCTWSKNQTKIINNIVLILVVVEDGLVPVFDKVNAELKKS